MKKILKISIWIITGIIGILLIGAAFMPSETIIESSIMIKAKPDKIFPYINCLKKSSEWSPWESVNEQSFTGPECGVGAMQAWKEESGSGIQKIIQSQENQYIKTELDFMEQGTATAELKLEPNGDSTKVTWTFESAAKYPLGRWIGIIFVKPVLTDNYAKGLKNLDSLIMNLTEEKPKANINPQIQEVKKKYYLSIRTESSMQEMGQKMGETYGRLMQFVKERYIECAGYPIVIWYNLESDILEYECAISTQNAAEGEDDIKSIHNYAGKAVVINHFGSYDKSHESWSKIDTFITEQGLEKNGNPWEEYLTNPIKEPDTTKWLTKLYQPVKSIVR